MEYDDKIPYALPIENIDNNNMDIDMNTYVNIDGRDDEYKEIERIELVLYCNRDIEIAIPVTGDINPELLVRNDKCELYKYCLVIPLSIIIVISVIYYI